MTKKIAFPRWPSEFPANMCRPVCLGGLTGRHWLAGNSEGHRGISKFLFLMVPYNYYRAWAIGIREVAFFYHLKFQSYIVHCNWRALGNMSQVGYVVAIHTLSGIFQDFLACFNLLLKWCFYGSQKVTTVSRLLFQPLHLCIHVHITFHGFSRTPASNFQNQT